MDETESDRHETEKGSVRIRIRAEQGRAGQSRIEHESNKMKGIMM